MKNKIEYHRKFTPQGFITWCLYIWLESQRIYSMSDEPGSTPTRSCHLNNGNTDIIQQNISHLANLKAYMAVQAAKNPPELSNSELFWQKMSRFQSKLSVKLNQNLMWWRKYYKFFKIKTLHIPWFLRKSIIKSQKFLQKFFFQKYHFCTN